jgi:hypothetical protein
LTPEGKIKALVKKLLADSERWGYIWSDWPVPAGYGKSRLDCDGSYYGRFFAIETKAPGKKPTPRQEATIRDMRRSGAAVFVVDGPESLAMVEKWLYAVRASNTGEEGATRTA